MNSTTSQNNLCVNTLKLLGDFWTLRIIDSLKSGDMRYCEVQRSVDNLNPTTLTDRLQKLEKADLIERREDVVGRASVVYGLTSKGKRALPILSAIDKFSQGL